MTTPSITNRSRRITPAAFRVALAAFLVLPLAAAAEGYDNKGFLYGRVKTESGTTYEGRLRWNGDEEAFWGDLFNGEKENLPYADEIPRSERQRGENEISIFGIKIGLRNVSWDDDGRVTVVRFGDVQKIKVGRGDDAVLTMKDGFELEVDGGSNDLGDTVYVWDRKLGEVDLKWSRIDTIEFMQAPADDKVDVFRLHGKVATSSGTFQGFIQWDQQECLSTDKLDGEGPDGDMAMEMGEIASIERDSHRASRVTLRNGREVVLSGTNDVDDDNRGIYVEDPRFGRVLVQWEAFERVDFSEPGSSGPTYAELEEGGPIYGTVTGRDGAKHTGEIVYDLDETQRWEMLNGTSDHVEYTIPFALVQSIEPGRGRSDVTLASGEKLRLEDATDVDDSNAGVLVLSGDKKTYVAWDDVERIDFEG